MYCPKCGKELPDDTKFCTGCGYGFNKENNNDDNNGEMKKSNNRNDHNGKKSVIKIIVFITVIASIVAFIKFDLIKDLANLKKEEDVNSGEFIDEVVDKTETEAIESEEVINDENMENSIETNNSNNNLNTYCTLVSGYGYVIGGFTDIGWTDSKTLYDSLNEVADYDVYNLTEKIGKFQGYKTTDVKTPEKVNLAIDGYSDDSILEFEVVAITSNWNPQAGKIINLDTNNQIYKDITKEVLIDNGIYYKEAYIEQLIKTDLENDGVDEVIIVVNDVVDSQEVEYSLVIFRKIINNEVYNFVLKDDLKSYYVPTLLDCNGDGVMEILIVCVYEDALETKVVEFKNGELREVLSNQCSR